MKISVTVKPNSQKQSFEKDKEIEYHYMVKLISVPKKGKANAELIKIVSHYFNLPKNKINIIKGLRSRQKIIKLDI